MKPVSVIKVGGAVVEDEASLLLLLQEFSSLPGRKVLVHGGGRSATRLAARLGIDSRMVNGRRVTDEETLRVVTMVYGGLVNKNLVARLQSFGVNALFADEALEASAEGFYKAGRNVVDFVETPGIVIDNVDREGLLRYGKSYSYGAELMLKYDFAKWNGWVSYTWSRAIYDIPELNDGKPYRSPLNHEHAVNFVLTYDISKRIAASSEWVFYSGSPTTYPVGRYSYMGTWVPVYSQRNSDRLPDYHRMDLSLTYRTAGRVEGKRWSGEWNLSIYNAYSRHNAWSIAFSHDRVEDKAKAIKIYLFTAIPSVSYNIKF